MCLPSAAFHAGLVDRFGADPLSIRVELDEP